MGVDFAGGISHSGLRGFFELPGTTIRAAYTVALLVVIAVETVRLPLKEAVA